MQLTRLTQQPLFIKLSLQNNWKTYLFDKFFNFFYKIC